jgi:hypothetical protein
MNELSHLNQNLEYVRSINKKIRDEEEYNEEDQLQLDLKYHQMVLD